MKKINWSETFKISLPYIGGLAFLILSLAKITNSAAVKQGNIEITIPGGAAVKVGVENEQVKLEDIIGKIEKNSRKEEALLFELKDRNIYRSSDSNLVNALKKNSFSEEISKKIRELWKESEGPFSYQTKMTIAIDDKLPEQKAKVCKHSFLANDQRLIVINENNNNRMVAVTINQVDPTCNINKKEDKLIISSDIAKELEIEPSSVTKATIDALFNNPRNDIIIKKPIS